MGRGSDMKKSMQINLTEGHTIWGNALIIIQRGIIRIYKIEKELTKKEKKALALNPKMALLLIKNKLRAGGPLTINDGEMCIDDMLVLRARNGEAEISMEL